MRHIVCDVRKDGDRREVVGISQALLRLSKKCIKKALENMRKYLVVK